MKTLHPHEAPTQEKHIKSSTHKNWISKQISKQFLFWKLPYVPHTKITMTYMWWPTTLCVLFNTHFVFIHIKNKKHNQMHTHPHTYIYKHIQPHILVEENYVTI
jgi:hypothetical protein